MNNSYKFYAQDLVLSVDRKATIVYTKFRHGHRWTFIEGNMYRFGQIFMAQWSRGKILALGDSYMQGILGSNPSWALLFLITPFFVRTKVINIRQSGASKINWSNPYKGSVHATEDATWPRGTDAQN